MFVWRLEQMAERLDTQKVHTFLLSADRLTNRIASLRGESLTILRSFYAGSRQF